MCLQTLEPTSPKTRLKTGYKLLKQIGGKLSTGYLQPNSQVLQEGEWVTDSLEYRKFAATEDVPVTKYCLGFHIFATLKGLSRFKHNFGWNCAVAQKVEFKNVVAVGTQCGYRVIVARKIKLLPVPDWKSGE